MTQVLNLTILAVFVAISFATICYGTIEPNRNCYNWDGKFFMISINEKTSLKGNFVEFEGNSGEN